MDRRIKLSWLVSSYWFLLKDDFTSWNWLHTTDLLCISTALISTAEYKTECSGCPKYGAVIAA